MKVNIQNVLVYVCIVEIVETIAINNFNLINNNNYELLTGAVKIMQKCFNERGRNLVLSGNLTNKDDFFILSRLHSSSIPINLAGIHEDRMTKMHKSFREFYQLNETIVQQKVYSANYFVTVASTHTVIVESLQKLKDSIWWNHEGVFFIVITNLSNGCEIARDCLRLVWSLNILSAASLCRSSSKKLLLYTFNPYSKFAPVFWNFYQETLVENHFWTLFEHVLNESEYQYSSSICKNLDFPKAKDLHGYEIKVGFHGIGLDVDEKKAVKTVHDIKDKSKDITLTLWNHLNASTKLIPYQFVNSDDETKPWKTYHDFFRKKIDISTSYVFQRDIWWLQTYPFDSSVICAIAREQTVPSTERLLGLFEPSSWPIIVIICFVAVWILKHLLEETLSESALELLRMVVGIPTQRCPKKSFKRRFFVVFVLVIMGANSYIQSRANSMVIAPIDDPQIETAEDLNASELLIYGYPNIKEFLFYENLRNRFRKEESNQKCIDRLKSGVDIVCVYTCSSFDTTEDNGTHIARQPMRILNTGFMIREDWPLNSRVNDILIRMSQAGLYRVYRDKYRAKFFKYQPEKSTWKPPKMEKIKIVFLALAWSELLAVCFFIAEVLIYKRRKLKSLCKRSY